MRPTATKAICAFALFIAQANAVSAQGATLLDDDAHAAWQAIGRVNQAGYKSKRLCSGTLIAPDLVLTAAHCVDQAHAPEDIVFVAGWHKGTHAAASRISEVHIHAKRGPDNDQQFHGLPFDIALLRLKTPIEQVVPLPLVPLGETVALVSYSGATPHALSGQFDCPVLSKIESFVRMGCPVIAGNSGGPLLSRTSEGWGVSGVVTARGAPDAPLSFGAAFDPAGFEDVTELSRP